MTFLAAAEAVQRWSAVLTGDVAQPPPAVIDSVLTCDGACATEFSPDGN